MTSLTYQVVVRICPLLSTFTLLLWAISINHHPKGISSALRAHLYLQAPALFVLVDIVLRLSYRTSVELYTSLLN